ncbi:RNA pseudouridine synthase [bacterium DOLJORAL78_65_58]|nr:MAG: RNA pseudouridine synthase [bacterium DOLZORAL124_64_63]PIE76759.1 MAG: RNA pseudouridine synthase [bacterium DOLJORAL78_65_58]
MRMLEFVHRDESCVVVNKPGGLLAVPGRGPEGADSVVSRLRTLIPTCIAQPAAHRLDMDTSGLMLLGLTAAAQRHLTRQFEARTVEKRYLAWLEGVLTEDEGRIALAFRLDPADRPRQIHDPAKGKPGITLWRRLTEDAGRTLVEFTPLTGRTHQLRVHAAHPLGLGCPIVGDRLYGSGTRPGELRLHAAFLAFDHPDDGRRISLESPFPYPRSR